MAFDLGKAATMQEKDHRGGKAEKKEVWLYFGTVLKVHTGGHGMSHHTWPGAAPGSGPSTSQTMPLADHTVIGHGNHQKLDRDPIDAAEKCTSKVAPTTSNDSGATKLYPVSISKAL